MLLTSDTLGIKSNNVVRKLKNETKKFRYQISNRFLVPTPRQRIWNHKNLDCTLSGSYNVKYPIAKKQNNCFLMIVSNYNARIISIISVLI